MLQKHQWIFPFCTMCVIVNTVGDKTPTSICPSPPFFCLCGLFQMWMSVLKKATAVRAVPTQRGASSAGAFRATSSDLTSAAAKLWVRMTGLCFIPDMWPQRAVVVWLLIKVQLHSVCACFSSNYIRCSVGGSWTCIEVTSFGGSGLDLDMQHR